MFAGVGAVPFYKVDGAFIQGLSRFSGNFSFNHGRDGPNQKSNQDWTVSGRIKIYNPYYNAHIAELQVYISALGWT